MKKPKSASKKSSSNKNQGVKKVSKVQAFKGKPPRITSGRLKGMEVRTVQDETTRPTSSRAREALMNILRDMVNNSCVWDFFAGSGTVGLDMISQGAKSLLVVENHPSVTRVLESNLENARERLAKNSTGPIPEMKLVKFDLLSQMTNFTSWSGSEDLPQIIFADPPYSLAFDWFVSVVDFLEEWLTADGLFVLEFATDELEKVNAEISKRSELPEFKLELLKVKSYGAGSMIILRRV